MAMGQRYTGVSATTPYNLVIDAGAVYTNYGEVSEKLLGATRGGSVFSVDQTFHDVNADGVPGAINGMSRLTVVECLLTVRMLELSTENLKMGFPGAVSIPYTSATVTIAKHDSIRRKRNIIASDYLKNVALVGSVMGKADPIICIIYNALQSSRTLLTTKDDDEAVMELIFRGHFDLTDLATEPWEVRYPLPAV